MEERKFPPCKVCGKPIVRRDVDEFNMVFYHCSECLAVAHCEQKWIQPDLFEDLNDST